MMNWEGKLWQQIEIDVEWNRYIAIILVKKLSESLTIIRERSFLSYF